MKHVTLEEYMTETDHILQAYVADMDSQTDDSIMKLLFIILSFVMEIIGSFVVFTIFDAIPHDIKYVSKAIIKKFTK